MPSDLILSLFPGIGLLDMAFEEAGFCVVRGPDLLWGGDIRAFHPPAGRFDGVIGGPPCQAFSTMRHLITAVYGAGRLAPNLIPEFERCVVEARPRWFLMENVRDAPLPVVEGYSIASLILNNRWLGEEQQRVRRFSFGVASDRPIDLTRHIEVAIFERAEWAPAVMASGSPYRRKTKAGVWKTSNRGVTWKIVAESLRLQGLPSDFFKHSPLTAEGQQKVLGNGVPLPMGRAVAKAVKAVLEKLL